MHDSSERRPGAGRPSLLSADQVPAQEDRSVLSQLDGRSAPARGASAPAPARHDHHQRGARAAVFAVAIAGIAILGWLAMGSVDESADATLAAAHAPTPVPPMPAAAPAPAVAAATIAPGAAAQATPATPDSPVTAETPATATIQDDLTAALDAPGAPHSGAATQPAPAAAAKAGEHELATLLNTPAAPAKPAKPAPDAGAGKSKPAADKLARADKAPVAAAKPKVAQKPANQKPAPAKKPAPAVDSDVAILAALLAHTKVPEAGSPEEIYKRCATNATAAEVQRCRVRVCQGSAKGAAECKSVRISKVSS